MSLVRKVKNKIRRMYFDFVPYRKRIDFNTTSIEFFYATKQAQEWYDPLKAPARLEYDWVLENIALENKNIIDAGAHHGQYSLVFAKGAKDNCNLLAIDPVPMNCLVTEMNMKLNNSSFDIIEAAVSVEEGSVFFENQSNGFINKDKGKLEVKTVVISSLMPDVEIVKLDVEGHEFEIIPFEIDKLKKVTNWIVEIHPSKNNNPNDLIKIFLDNGYEVLWVNRDTNKVEPYTLGTAWNIHSTIFASK